MRATSRKHSPWNSKEYDATSWRGKQNALKGGRQWIHLMSRAQIGFSVVFRELATWTAAHVRNAQVHCGEL